MAEKISDHKINALPELSSDSSSQVEGSVELPMHEKFGILRKLRDLEHALDRKLGIEVQGINRVTQEDKEHPSLWNILFLWFSLVTHIANVPIGMAGPLLGLSLRQSIGAIFLGLPLGALCTAFCATISIKTGLRQVACARYSFGFHGTKLCSVLNIVVLVGFAVINVVVSGEILSAVSDFGIPPSIGCIIIALLGFIISIFGFRVILVVERYAWILVFVLMLLLFGMVAPHIDASLPGTASGANLAGAFLSAVAINFSNGSGWVSMAGDYYVHYPATTSKQAAIGLTLIGICVPSILTSCLGVMLINSALTYPPLIAAYGDHGFGGLLLATIHPADFSKFVLVLLMFSVVASNSAVLYSAGLSIQLLGDFFHAVPRFLWSLLVAIVLVALAIAGGEHLTAYIEDFLGLLGYWAIAFAVILFLEDTVFRKNIGYDLEVWNKASNLPVGVAAVAALVIGFCAGGIPGMAQTWYRGVIARQIGQYGGDVGMYMSGAVAFTVYLIGRHLELKKFGR